MATALNSITEEEILSLEKEEGGNILYKGDNTRFVYNRLHLGIGTLYITRTKFIWIKQKENKKVYTDFKNLSTNNIYLNYYEKNRDFFLHLLNDVNNISIDSKNITLHALSSDKKLCNEDCIYIQLNNDIFNAAQNGDTEKNDDDQFLTDEEEQGQGQELDKSDEYKKKNHIENTKNQKKILEHDDSNNNNNFSNCESDAEDIFNISNITPEILLIGENSTVNNIIFQQMSNFDDCLETDSYDGDFFDEDNNSQAKSS